MRIGAVIATYSYYPKELFESVEATKHEVSWRIHHHGDDLELERKLEAFAETADVDLRLHRVNRGLSRSWNDGLEASLAAHDDVTLLLNDDLFFYEDGFDKFVEYLAEHPGFGIVEAHGFETQTGMVSHQGAACCAIGKAAIEAIGFFDENLTPAYCEDTDYWLRARKAGIPLLGDDRILVEHDRSRTLRTAAADTTRRISRAHEANKAYFIRKWGGLWRTGMEDIKFETPFDDPRFGLKIAGENRAAPYGRRYDRRNGQFSWNLAHIQNRGDIWSPTDEWCGQPGSGLWIEGVLLTAGESADASELEFAAVTPDGFTDWAKCGEYLGGRGESVALRGLSLRLTGRAAKTRRISGASTFVGAATRPAAVGSELVFIDDHLRPLESFRFSIEGAP